MNDPVSAGLGIFKQKKSCIGFFTLQWGRGPFCSLGQGQGEMGREQGSRNESALSAAMKATFNSRSHFKLAAKAKLPRSHFKLAGTASQPARQPASKVASQSASEQASF